MHRLLTACIVLSYLASGAFGDVLELKSGDVLNGKYSGGTAGTIRFEDAQGVRVFETGQVIALTFTTAPDAPAAAAPTQPPAAPVAAAPAAQAVTVPSGTTLLVRMMDSISSENKTGTRFTTTLEQDLVVNGVVAIKAGTKVYGELRSATKAGRGVGRPTIDIRLNQVALGAEMPLIATSSYKEKGDESARKVAGAAAVGAGVGAVFNGGKGAGRGAAAAAAGSLVVKGDTVTVPPGTLLEFQLTQPLNITATP